MAHNHNHHHNHAHHHHSDTQSTLSFDEKMLKLLEHWIKHNDDHANTYRDWAERARQEDMADVCSLLKDAADITISVSKKFEQALELIKKD